MSFFANFADSWEDPEGAMALLHRMQQARSLFMRSYLPATAKLGLDIGCGGGINTLDLARCGYEMTGIDSESSLIAVAQKQSDKQHLLVQWHHSCITEFHPPELYDFICCYEVLEHVRDPSEACAKILQWLKPGGVLFISTLNRTAQAYFIAIFLGEYVCKYLPVGTHSLEQFIAPEELNKMLQPAVCLGLRGMIYNPLERRFFIGHSLATQYIGAWQNTGCSRL